MTALGRAEPRRPRRAYLDWMRGLAVLVMIEAHVLDSWTRLADRNSPQFAWSMIVGGFGAPLFLFLAGVAVALSAGSKLRRNGSVSEASRAVMTRGVEIFGLAFLFRVQAWILGWSSPRTLLKVDILNIMGPSIVVAAALWGAARGTRDRYVLFAGATLAMAFSTPIVRGAAILDGLPDSIEAYLRPTAGLNNFAFFPWAGFVFAGAILGLAIDRVTTREAEARLNLLFVAAGGGLALSAYAASYLPSPFAHSQFWGSSPAFFLIRAGLLTTAVGLSYLWVARSETAGWSPLEQLGRTSFFIYWIHVEMVYGLISLPLHKTLSLREAWVAYAAFCLFLLMCSIAKDEVVQQWKRRSMVKSLIPNP